MLYAEDKESYLCLNKFESLDNERCPVPSLFRQWFQQLLVVHDNGRLYGGAACAPCSRMDSRHEARGRALLQYVRATFCLASTLGESLNLFWIPDVQRRETKR